MKKYIYTLLGFLSAWLFLFALPAHATNTITFDSSSTKATVASTNSTSSIAVGTGNNFALFACENTNAAGDNVTAMTVSSTVGKFAMTFVASTTGGTRPAFLYEYTSSTMTAQTLTVSSSINASVKGNIGLSSFFGVNQTTPVDQTNNVLMAGTTNVTTTLNLYIADEYLTDCVSTNGTPNVTSSIGQIVTASTSVITPTIRAGYLHFINPSSSVLGWFLNPSALADYLVAGILPIFTQTSTIQIIASSTANPSIVSAAATTSFTTVSGTNTILDLEVIGTTSTSTGAMFNGVSMTNAVELVGCGICGYTTLEHWYLVNPPVGTFTVSTTYNSGSGKLGFVMTELSNVNQKTPIDVAGSSTNQALSIFNLTPTLANDFGIDMNGVSKTGIGPYQFFLGTFTSPNPQNSAASYEVGFSDTSTIGFGWSTNPGDWEGVLFEQAPNTPPPGGEGPILASLFGVTCYESTIY